jgi:hypothetical protein
MQDIGYIWTVLARSAEETKTKAVLRMDFLLGLAAAILRPFGPSGAISATTISNGTRAAGLGERPIMSCTVTRVLMAVLATCAATSASQNTLAQEIDFGNPEFERTIRVKYVNSPELPDGVAFTLIMQVLEALNEDSRSDTVETIQLEMKLDKKEAEQFLALMLNTQLSYTEEVHKRSMEMACSLGVPRAAGNDVYSLFERMDDAVDDLGTEYLSAIVDEIGEKKAINLHKWIDRQKVNVVAVRYKHKEYYERRGASADAEIASICNVSISTDKTSEAR